MALRSRRPDAPIPGNAECVRAESEVCHADAEIGVHGTAHWGRPEKVRGGPTPAAGLCGQRMFACLRVRFGTAQKNNTMVSFSSIAPGVYQNLRSYMQVRLF